MVCSPGRSACSGERWVYTYGQWHGISILYKLLRVVQELQIRDYEQRKDFSFRMQVILEQNKQKAVGIMSDIRHIFNLNMMVKKQILPHSIPENPRKILQKLYSLSALLFGMQFLLLRSQDLYFLNMQQLKWILNATTICCQISCTLNCGDII